VGLSPSYGSPNFFLNARAADFSFTFTELNLEEAKARLGRQTE
jgi:hypothetical protein